MSNVIDLQSHLEKNTTIAIINKTDQKVRGILSIETTETRYCFTQETGKIKLVTAQDAERVIEDLSNTLDGTGIRTFNQDEKTWSIIPLDEIEFVASSVEFLN